MLNEKQKKTFADRGVVRVDKLIERSLVDPARELAYDALSRLGLWRDDAWIGPTDTAALNRQIRMLKQRAASDRIRELLTEQVLAAARELAGGQAVTATNPQMQLLFTQPQPAVAWTVPHRMWHLDVARLGDLGAPGVQMFTFLDSVTAGAGGTLLVAGSHRLLNGSGVLGSKEVKRRLKRHLYFRQLLDPATPDRQRFLHEAGEADSVPLQVVELTGEPGDVYFTDMRLLHSLGPNTSARPRLMITQRLPRTSVADKMGDAYADLARSRKAGRAERRDEADLTRPQRS